MNNNDVNRIIDTIISNPHPDYTREYAQELLRSCGILDDNNEIVPIYRDIITENKSRCHKCVYELNCLIGDRDSKGKCPHYKRDAPDGGYYG